MNERFKFRFWNKKTEKHYNVVELSVEFGTVTCSEYNKKYELEDNTWTFNIDDGMVEQFTGLTDKNGKEIYEGDSLTDNIIVVFENGSYRTTYESDCQNGNLLTSKRCEYVDIIGNIHENQELIH